MSDRARKLFDKTLRFGDMSRTTVRVDAIAAYEEGTICELVITVHDGSEDDTAFVRLDELEVLVLIKALVNALKNMNELAPPRAVHN